MAEDKKIIELADEALNEAAGGDGVYTRVRCTACKEGYVGVPASGKTDAECPKCHATLFIMDGVVQYNSEPPKITEESWDTDDYWL